jgi:hypothetical protein
MQAHPGLLYRDVVFTVHICGYRIDATDSTLSSFHDARKSASRGGKAGESLPLSPPYLIPQIATMLAPDVAFLGTRRGFASVGIDACLG